MLRKLSLPVLAVLATMGLSLAADLSTEDGFIAAYRAAREQKDITQFRFLAHTARASDADKERFAKSAQLMWTANTGTIKTVRIIAGAPEGIALERVVHGITRVPNLPVTHTLLIEWNPPASGAGPGESCSGLSFFGGRFWIPMEVNKPQ